MNRSSIMKKTSPLFLSFLLTVNATWSSPDGSFHLDNLTHTPHGQQGNDLQHEISRVLSEDPNADVTSLLSALTFQEATEGQGPFALNPPHSPLSEDEAYARELDRELNGDGAQEPFLSLGALEQASEESALGTSPTPLEPPEPIFERFEDEDLVKYIEMRRSFLAIAEGADVHSMTRTFAKTHYGLLKFIENKYFKMTCDLNEEQIMAGLSTFLADCERPAQKALLTSPELQAKTKIMMDLLEKGKGFWTPGANDVDPETGISLRELFARVYLFMKRRDEEQVALFLARHGYEREDLAFFGYFCDKLAENIMEGGGCHPGIAGRLVYTFAHFLS